MLRGKISKCTSNAINYEVKNKTRQAYFLINNDTGKNEILSLEKSNEKVSNELSEGLLTNNLTLDSVFQDKFNVSHSDNNLNSVSDIVNDNLCNFSKNSFENDDTHNFNAFTPTSTSKCTTASSVEFSIESSLQEWALNFNISHTALNSLLSILSKRKCKACTSLPKDARTLLQTPRNVSLTVCEPGF